MRLRSLAITLWVTTTAAGEDGRSFADAFFVSRRADGSLEVLGSAVTWLLLVLSVVGIGVAVHMALANRRSNVLPPDLVQRVEDGIRKKRFRYAIEQVSRDSSYFGRVLHGAFREAKFGFPAMMRALEQTADELATARMRRIELLNVLGQVSPMIGLFGTVYGMILAFSAIVSSGGAADPVMLAGGIGTALTTTFWGLVVAIPTLVLHSIIQSQTTKIMNDIDLYALKTVNLLGARRRGSLKEEVAT